MARLTGTSTSSSCRHGLCGFLLLLLAHLPVCSATRNDRRLQSRTNMSLTILQRMSDARIDSSQSCAEGMWRGLPGEQRCYLGKEWQAVAVGGILAAKHFNERNGKYVPRFARLAGCDKHLVLDVLDSQSTGTPATKALLGSGKSQCPVTWPDAIVGPARSAASIQTANVAGVFDVIQVSYWSTSAKLNDMNVFPYFMRTIIIDDAVAKMTCAFWNELGYRYAAVLFINDAYGEAYKEAVITECQALGIDVSPFIQIEKDYSSTKVSLDRINEAGLNVVLAVVFGDEFKQIMEYGTQIGVVGPGKMWLFSDGVTSANFEAIQDPKVREAASGSFRVIAAGGDANTNPRWPLFLGNFPSQNVADVNKFLPVDWQLPQNFFTEFAANSSNELRDIGAYEYDAVAAVALAACEHSSTGPLGKNFSRQMWKNRESLRFDGLTGDVAFDSVGNRKASTGNYLLENIVLLENAGAFTQYLSSPFQRINDRWTFREDSSKKLVYMGGDNTSPPDYDKPIEKLNQLHDGAKIFVIILVTIAFLSYLSLSCWISTHSRHPAVRTSQPLFLRMILLGAAVSTSNMILFIFDDGWIETGITEGAGGPGEKKYQDLLWPSLNVMCVFQPWLYCVGFALTYGSLMLKTWRVKELLDSAMKEAAPSSMTDSSTTPRYISIGTLFRWMSVFIVVQAVVLIVWTIVDPLRFERRSLEVNLRNDTLSSVGSCVATNGWAFLSPLTAMQFISYSYALIILYQARRVHTAFSERKYITMCLASNLQVLVLSVPLLSLVAENPTALLIVKACAVFINDYTVICLIFIPKVYVVMTVSAKTVRQIHRDAASDMVADNLERRKDSGEFALSAATNRSGGLPTIPSPRKSQATARVASGTGPAGGNSKNGQKAKKKRQRLHPAPGSIRGSSYESQDRDGSAIRASSQASDKYRSSFTEEDHDVITTPTDSGPSASDGGVGGVGGKLGIKQGQSPV